MWSLVASLLAMALLATIALMVDTHAQQSVQQLALTRAEQQSALLLAQFAAAAKTYANQQNGAVQNPITVPTLINAGALPASFPSVDAMGLTFKAQVGNVSSGAIPVIAWADGVPTQLYGFNVQAVFPSVALHVAQDAAAAQQNAGALVGTIQNASGRPALQLPFATQTMDLSGTFPGLNVNSPDAAVVYMQ